MSDDRQLRAHNQGDGVILKSSQADPMAGSMAPDKEQFLKVLGGRIAQLRKDQCLSQQAMADALEIAQQTYAHYEVGRTRMPMSLLPEIALFELARYWSQTPRS